MTALLKKLQKKYGAAAMHADNKDTGHNRTIHITGIENAPLTELTITVMYTKDNEGQTTQKAVTLDNAVIPAIIAALNKGSTTAKAKGKKEEKGEADASDGKWIKDAINPAHKGDLRKKAGVKKGEKIPEKTLKKLEKSKNPTTRKQAHLADNLKHLKHK